MVSLPDEIMARVRGDGPRLVHDASEWSRQVGNSTDNYGAAALDDECRKVATAANGTRNETLNRAAFALGQLVAGGALSENDVRTRLHGAAVACGLSNDEIGPTITSGLQGGAQTPRAAPVPPSRQVGDLSDMRVAEKPALLATIRASDFAGKPVPARKALDDKGMIPWHGVTLLYGDGGTGKSLLALQLLASTVTGQPWLGTPVKQGPVLYFSAEDTADEMHRRLDAICQFYNTDLADLGGLHIANMAGTECVLGAADKQGVIKPTPLFGRFAELVDDLKPRLIVIDNAVDVFAGDQNSAAQVKQFMQLLTGLSIDADCPVVMLAHPSKAGMATGTGDAGSVHWSNSARSRLYLSRVYTHDGEGQPIEDDPCARVLRVMKANYAATGTEIEMRWETGVMVHRDAERPEPGDPMFAAVKAERVFMHLLSVFERQGRRVSATPSSTYAPTQFAKHDQREGVSKRRFEAAMNSLFDQGKIKIEEHGPPSTRRKHIAIVEGEE